MDVLYTNIGLLATPRGVGAKKGGEQGDILLLQNAAVGVADGKIVYAGEIDTTLDAQQVVDCKGRLVTPGLVDAHTHLVFGGWRQKELGQKLAGVPYLDILKDGGGILRTVRRTRAATEDHLAEKAQNLLHEMFRHGTTTCECKSGYGLDLDTELKQLRVVNHLQGTQPVELVSTYLGAHAVPEEYKDNRQGYIDFVCDEVLPAVSREKLAEYCDVFCETGVFNAEESARILGRAKELGLGIKAHVDEIDPIGGSQMAARLGCISAEHLIVVPDDAIADMAKASTIAVLLPATSFYLDKPYARARDMVAAGVPVAVGSDFNPGSSPNLNLQLPMQLACLKYRLTPAEALTAVTLNAAASIGRAGSIGTIEAGKQADMVIWNAPDLDYIFYRYGSNLARTVVKKGVAYS